MANPSLVRLDLVADLIGLGLALLMFALGYPILGGPVGPICQHLLPNATHTRSGGPALAVGHEVAAEGQHPGHWRTRSSAPFPRGR